jgi:chemotaxis protein histidine kinase CheA
MRAILIAGLLAVGGCASLGQADQPSPEATFERALVALQEEDFQTAYEHLSWIYYEHAHRPIGERALLTLAAVEMDPRNTGRRLDVGAELAGRYFQHPNATPWSGAVSQTMYLLAMELGAAEERLARAEAERERAEREREQAERERQTARAEASRASATARQARSEAARARTEAARARAEARRAQAGSQARAAPAQPARQLPQLSSPSVSARVSTLQGERDRLAGEVRALNRRLAEQEQELERIRRTLAPRPQD